MLCVTDRQTVSIMKACELAAVSRRTIYNWLNAGKLEHVRTAGGSVRIFADSLFRPAGRKAADIASWATAGTLVTLDAIHSAKADNPGRAFTVQGARIGVTYGGVWLAKTLVHRTRPCAPECGIDNPFLSFYSGHSATAGQAIGGARLSITLPLALGTGGLRILAGKHYFTDVVAGELAGYAASRWIR
jgi:excisionase family DNA binding protein